MAGLQAGQIRGVFAGVLLAQFLSSLELTIVAPALSTMAGDLGQRAYMPWIAATYLLMATVSTPLYGKASDIYGSRRILRVALALFAVGSVVCAVATSMLWLAPVS